MNFLQNHKGFTLIELIVVIGVVAILSTALLSVLNPGAQIQKARDTQRRADISKIQAALEFVRADFGCYPSSSCTITALPNCNAKLDYPATGVTYLDRMPCDPNNTTYNSGRYFYSSNGNTYTLGACLERESDPAGQSCPGGTCNCTSGKYYVVENP